MWCDVECKQDVVSNFVLSQVLENLGVVELPNSILTGFESVLHHVSEKENPKSN